MTMTVMRTRKAQVLAEELVALPEDDLATRLGVAADLAREVLEQFVAALAGALDEGWEVIEIDLTPDGGDVWVQPHTGAMVGWFLDDWLADALRVEGGETDLHLTLAYLGDVADLTPEQTRVLTGVVAEVASRTPALYGEISGQGTFENHDDDGNPQTVWWAGVNLVGLDAFHDDLVGALEAAGIPVKTYDSGWHPHITLAFLDGHGAEAGVPVVEFDPQAVRVREITVALAGTRHTIALADPDAEAYREWEDTWYAAHPWHAGSAYRPLVKSVIEAERRFTLGPWYIPNTEDAHGEWTDPDTLQEAAWKYVRSGYRSIHLQHSPDIVAGEWVEIMTLPHETTWPVIDVNGNVLAHTYPAGTVMLGVVWQPWAWELVKSGAITGYSIGGYAGRTDEDIPDGGETED